MIRPSPHGHSILHHVSTTRGIAAYALPPYQMRLLRSQRRLSLLHIPPHSLHLCPLLSHRCRSPPRLVQPSAQSQYRWVKPARSKLLGSKAPGQHCEVETARSKPPGQNSSGQNCPHTPTEVLDAKHLVRRYQHQVLSV
eukprot:454381-Rhodomonas_salina.1